MSTEQHIESASYPDRLRENDRVRKEEEISVTLWESLKAVEGKYEDVVKSIPENAHDGPIALPVLTQEKPTHVPHRR